jgi:HNH endonuclease
MFTCVNICFSRLVILVNAHPFIGRCIYCGSTNQLSDEHVLPYGLGGALVLKKASCRDCSKVTAALEERLLRGHWWSYRLLLGIKTRSGAYPNYRPVKLVPLAGEKRPAHILSADYPIVVFLDFDPPAVLSGEIRPETPCAKAMCFKQIGNSPTRALVDGSMRNLLPWEKIEYPANFESSDLLRFIAKVAHAYAIHQCAFQRSWTPVSV